ncbi:uncharacterized protein [Littorina saxatilis]|uniref:uncharacterized protein isoform X2 n=1 Tax=Littorina saxatilis TaxID=31220 RepID=UPI0038B43E2B
MKLCANDIVWLLVFCYCLVSGSATDRYPHGIWSEPFHGTQFHLVGCSQPLPGPGAFAKLELKVVSGDTASSALVFLDHKETCTGSSTLATCEYMEGRSVTVRVVITDLSEGETRWYQCVALYIANPDRVITLNESVINTGISTRANRAVSLSASSPRTPTQDAVFPDSLVVVLLVLLIMMMTSACVLGVYYCRRRLRTPRSRDDDAMSMRSGMTSRSNCSPASLGYHGYEEESVTGTLPRQMSASCAPPVGQAPDVPGNCRVVMQYQKSIDL